MISSLSFVFLLFGLAIGAVITYVVTTQRARLLQQRLESESNNVKTALAEQKASQDRDLELHKAESQRANELALKLREAETRREADAEQIKRLERIQEIFADKFKALSADALKSNNEEFLKLAKVNLEKFQENAKGDLEKRQIAIDRMVLPIRESLDKVDEKIQNLEKVRNNANVALTEQIKHLMTMGVSLQSETANLVKALRAPQVRGRWGEMQLRRTVEMAGLINHCDFTEQTSVATEDGPQRPDMLVHLPNDRLVVVDAKAPLAAYLEALEAGNPDVQAKHMADHARQVRDHLKKLGSKQYWKQFKEAPEFVVLFLPGESFFSAALQQDAALIDYGVENRVILATPTTLIALLKAVAFGWRQEAIAREAAEISRLGNELYERVGVLGKHLGKIRKGLDTATDAYNDAVRSVESRLLPTARRFRELQATTNKVIEPLEQANENLLNMTAEELNAKADKEL
ncbi:DNA recombination protein RmuC [Rubellicoccus peritrichatus]|uniref:DNA recombination protein RmuC n=1 Tax=Rubellicoccus peritrichatus TaxID=3080537 RepID=A0AAQ3QQ55_9BACT|nr:DNA recombination protein RmuC [Puniceicoccus sp. CR14]WOO39863.1 DNA recombination protein RmuC [Puniceicoccus sp. CR14]